MEERLKTRFLLHDVILVPDEAVAGALRLGVIDTLILPQALAKQLIDLQE